MPPKKKYHLLESRKETFRGATMRGLKGRPRKVRWPHESPSEYNMAESGFYFTPSTGTDAGDAVTCYMCGCVIDGWDPEDDPVEVHYEHNAQCSKAILRKAPWKLTDDAGHEYFDPAHDPYSENSVLTRLESFFHPLSEREKRKVLLNSTTLGISIVDSFLKTAKSLWPHDAKKGWIPSSVNLARAGFFFDPCDDGDESVCCQYCGRSLEDWDPQDNPIVEHKKRSPGCFMFTCASYVPNSPSILTSKIPSPIKSSEKPPDSSLGRRLRARSTVQKQSSSKDSENKEDNNNKNQKGKNKKGKEGNDDDEDEDEDDDEDEEDDDDDDEDAIDNDDEDEYEDSDDQSSRKRRSSSFSDLEYQKYTKTKKPRAPPPTASSTGLPVAKASLKKFRLSSLESEDDSNLFSGATLPDLVPSSVKKKRVEKHDDSDNEVFGMTPVARLKKSREVLPKPYDSMASSSGARIVSNIGSVSEKISKFEELMPASSRLSGGGPALNSPQFPKKHSTFSPRPKEQHQQQSALDIVVDRSQSLKQSLDRAKTASSALFARASTIHGTDIKPTAEKLSLATPRKTPFSPMPTIPSVPMGLADIIGDEKQKEEKENKEIDIIEKKKTKVLDRHLDEPIHNTSEVLTTLDNLKSSPPPPRQQQQQPQRLVISPKKPARLFASKTSTSVKHSKLPQIYHDPEVSGARPLPLPPPQAQSSPILGSSPQRESSPQPSPLRQPQQQVSSPRIQHVDNWSRLNKDSSRSIDKCASPAPLPSSPVLAPSSPAQQNAESPGESPKSSFQGSPERDDVEMEDLGNYADTEQEEVENNDDDDDCLIVGSQNDCKKTPLRQARGATTKNIKATPIITAGTPPSQKLRSETPATAPLSARALHHLAKHPHMLATPCGGGAGRGAYGWTAADLDEVFEVLREVESEDVFGTHAGSKEDWISEQGLLDKTLAEVFDHMSDIAYKAMMEKSKRLVDVFAREAKRAEDVLRALPVRDKDE